MNRLYGITVTDDNVYQCAAVVQNEKGCRLTSLRTLNLQNELSKLQLLHRGIRLGLPHTWKKKDSLLSTEGMLEIAPEGPYNGCLYESEASLHTAVLKGNLTGIVSEDSYLATIPLYFSKEPAESFISLHDTGNFYAVGIVIKKKLLLSLKAVPHNPDNLPGFFGRLERYWRIQNTSISFPEKVFLLGSNTSQLQSFFKKPPIRVSAREDIDDTTNALQATGAALTHLDDPLPPFSGPTPQSHFRTFRTFSYLFSIACVVLTFLAVAGISATHILFRSHRIHLEQTYRNAITENEEIGALKDSAGALADTVLSLTTFFSGSSAWGQFLFLLSNDKPEGLFIERLGSEPASNAKNSISLAFHGWALKESLITVFVTTLQETPFLSNVTLITMAHDKRYKEIVRYTITCTLLSKNR